MLYADYDASEDLRLIFQQAHELVNHIIRFSFQDIESTLFQGRFQFDNLRAADGRINFKAFEIKLFYLFFLGFHDLHQLGVSRNIQSFSGPDDTGRIHFNDFPGTRLNFPFNNHMVAIY